MTRILFCILMLSSINAVGMLNYFIDVNAMAQKIDFGELMKKLDPQEIAGKIEELGRKHPLLKAGSQATALAKSFELATHLDDTNEMEIIESCYKGLLAEQVTLKEGQTLTEIDPKTFEQKDREQLMAVMVIMPVRLLGKPGFKGLFQSLKNVECNTENLLKLSEKFEPKKTKSSPKLLELEKVIVDV